MNSRYCYLSGIVLVAACTTLALSADEPKAVNNLAAEIETLAAERVKTATSAWGATGAAYVVDTAGLTDMLKATQTLFEAELAVCSTPKEQIAVHQQNVDRATKIETKITALYKAQSKGGEAEKYYTAKCAFETAKIEMLKARLRLGINN